MADAIHLVDEVEQAKIALSTDPFALIRLSGQDLDVWQPITRSQFEVLIAVADHGPGMSSGYRTDRGRGVGLRNVDVRLQKTYGPGHRLEIRANEPQGTVVTIKIPIRQGT